jgi:hypothetical protein
MALSNQILFFQAVSKIRWSTVNARRKLKLEGRCLELRPERSLPRIDRGEAGDTSTRS